MKQYEVGPDDQDPKDQVPDDSQVKSCTTPEDSDPPPAVPQEED